MLDIFVLVKLYLGCGDFWGIGLFFGFGFGIFLRFYLVFYLVGSFRNFFRVGVRLLVFYYFVEDG